MHWTAYLAYRRLHADAKIVGDLRCINCSYNLRGLRTIGACPECGGLIEQSLYVLSDPTAVSQAFRTFSNSYLTLFILVIGCVTNLAGWIALVTAAVLACGSVYRLWSAGSLHYRADLSNAEALASGTRWFWRSALAEMFIALLWIGIVVAVLYTPTLQTARGSRLIVDFCIVWTIVACINAYAAGRLAASLASSLGYGWLIIEFRVQGVLTGLAALATFLMFVAVHGSLNTAAAMLLLVVVGLGLTLAVAVTWVSLHHIANVANEASETFHDAIEMNE